MSCGAKRPPNSFAVKLLGEEAHHLGIERAMECRPVEFGRRIDADARYSRGKLCGAGREEGEVGGRDDVNLRMAGKAACDVLRTLGGYTIAAQLGSPDLKRNPDARQI